MSQILYVTAFTVVQALCSTVIALLIGISLAFFTANRKFFGKKLLLSFSAIPLCLPPLLMALGFVSFFGISGTLNTIIKSVFNSEKPFLTFLYSFWGIIIAQGFYNFPIIMATVHDSWINLPQGQKEAARVLGASESRIFRTITLFQLMPSIASSCMIVFLYCFFSFLIVLLFGGIGCTTLEVEIYKSAKAELNFLKALKLSVIETLFAVFFISVYTFLEKISSKTRGISFYQKELNKKISGFSEKIFFALIIILTIIFFISPVFSIVYNAFSSNSELFTLATLKKVTMMKGFINSLGTTFSVAVTSSSFCVLIAFFYAVFVRSVDSENKFTVLRLIPMIPLAISSVILGTLISFIVQKGSVIHLIFAQIFLTWPIAFRQIFSSLSKIQNETIDAAKILSPNFSDLIFKIYLPQSLRGILGAFGFCFAVSAGDTTLPLVLAIPKFTNLSLFTYRLAGSYRFHEACASGLILGIICMLIFSLTNKLKD